jgi:hypothetical protein
MLKVGDETSRRTEDLSCRHRSAKNGIFLGREHGLGDNRISTVRSSLAAQQRFEPRPVNAFQLENTEVRNPAQQTPKHLGLYLVQQIPPGSTNTPRSFWPSSCRPNLR